MSNDIEKYFASQQGKAYVAQIRTMSEKGKAWRKANPEREALIQFNFPPGVQVVGPTISEAIRDKLVTTNEAGLELIKAMAPWGGRDEATISMVQYALDL